MIIAAWHVGGDAVKFVKMSLALFTILGVILINFGMKDSGNAQTPVSPTAYHSLDKLSLNLFIDAPSSARLPDPASDVVRQEIEKRFNVDLDVTVMAPGDEYNSTIASLLASNDPPDMWLVSRPDGGAKYILDNVLADMTHYIAPDTMPNYFKHWISEKELREYQMQNKFARAPVPYDKQSYRAYYIRKDWLVNLGMDIPNHYEEYVDVLRAFTFNDPDKNGLDDTYGFSTAGNGVSISLEWPEYVKNGLLFPSYYGDDHLVDMQTDLRVGRVVDDILNVIDEGVVDPDWFLNKGNKPVEKAIQGKVGVIMGETADFAFDSNPRSVQARSKESNPAADWVPFNPFGNQPLRTSVTPDYSFVFSNNAAGQNPEKLKRIVDILDWMAGEEGFLLTHYGMEGKHYTRKGNTITLMTDAIEKDVQERGDLFEIWSFFTPRTPEVLGLTVLDSRITERDKAVYRSLVSFPVREGLGTTLTPPLGIDVDAMRSRQNELQVKMLFSDKSGEYWPEYRQEIMDFYEGNQIFRQYEEKIRAARINR